MIEWAQNAPDPDSVVLAWRRRSLSAHALGAGTDIAAVRSSVPSKLVGEVIANDGQGNLEVKHEASRGVGSIEETVLIDMTGRQDPRERP